MSALVKYNAARTALAEAHAIDEVKDIRDKAEAMAAYARQAKDTEMIQWVTEIKVRAERRAGQMLAEMPKARGELKNVSRSHDVTAIKTLSEIGITKNESSRWQKLAAIPETQFEQAVNAAKEVAGEVTTAAMLRVERAQSAEPKAVEQITGKRPGAKPESVDETQELRAHLEEMAALAKTLQEENESMGKVIDADDRLAVLAAENRQLRELNRVLNERIHGLQNECNEAKRAAKMWRAKHDKLENLAA